jgi:hypothetical protein
VLTNVKIRIYYLFFYKIAVFDKNKKVSKINPEDLLNFIENWEIDLDEIDLASVINSFYIIDEFLNLPEETIINSQKRTNSSNRQVL